MLFTSNVARGAWLLVLVTSLAVASCVPASAPQPTAAAPSTPLNPPVKVTVGLLASTTDSGIFIAQDHGYFREEGIELDLQHFQTLVDMVAPVSNGQLQVAAGALAAGLYNAAARNVGVKIVADKGHVPGREWEFSALVIRKGLIDSGQVKEAIDLSKLIDTSFQEAAVAALGPYAP